MTQDTTNYAFIDDNNVVINICVFADTNPDLIDHIKNDMGAKLAISCEEFGNASIGGTWNGEHFLYEDGARVPLTNRPQDIKNHYKYDFEIEKWVIVGVNLLYSE
jgi:hypothetical protein